VAPSSAAALPDTAVGEGDRWAVAGPAAAVASVLAAAALPPAAGGACTTCRGALMAVRVALCLLVLLPPAVVACVKVSAG